MLANNVLKDNDRRPGTTLSYRSISQGARHSLLAQIGNKDLDCWTSGTRAWINAPHTLPQSWRDHYTTCQLVKRDDGANIEGVRRERMFSALTRGQPALPTRLFCFIYFARSFLAGPSSLFLDIFQRAAWNSKLMIAFIAQSRCRENLLTASPFCNLFHHLERSRAVKGQKSQKWSHFEYGR